MSAPPIHELDFCAEVAKYSKEIFDQDQTSPFSDARIEGFGTGKGRRKKKGLRFYDKHAKVALTGEVKLPGKPDGQSPYAADLVHDAQAKADDAGAQYFFTWNVNTFVLWDRFRQEVPLLERRVREWNTARYFRNADEVGREQSLLYIKRDFLPSLLFDIGEIYAGRRPDWPMPPDDLFIRSLESHLAWPAELTRSFLANEAQGSRSFDTKLQEWMVDQNWQFVRSTPELWDQAIDRAARTMVYVLANRLIFYQSLKARFPELARLRLPARADRPAEIYSALQRFFENAVRCSGDYEPLFYPHERTDWAGPHVFAHPEALDAWRGALRGIEAYDFSHISSDIVGRIFQRLISPEERHRWGQHFTGDDVVDLINGFCIRHPDDTILDPACGSGSFLVRAYYRKRFMNIRKPHVELLSELFGSDLALYPAHLATLNLAAREINEEANYPRIARADFFDIKPSKPFCVLPEGHSTQSIMLPELSVVIGNPPYVRHELIDRRNKLKMQHVVGQRWPGLKMPGRSDLHCYFWPAAAYFLKDDGYFGFLSSSSWLDVDYGFPLQRWILENFRIVAICESDAEPWFEDARVKTCVTILQRSSDRNARTTNTVKFVQVKKPLAEIIVERPDSEARFIAIEKIRTLIETHNEDFEDDRIRIIAKGQAELWKEGVRAGRVLEGLTSFVSSDEEEETAAEEEATEYCIQALGPDADAYVAGKWGRYVRAPQFYFDIMKRFGSKFAAIGEIADLRFGVKSGCDAFFMPHDITSSALKKFETDATFRRRYGVDRSSVERSDIKIVKAGDDSEHPIEAKYLAPEVHTLRDFQQCTMRVADCTRVILLVDKPIGALSGSLVARYLRYGETHKFASGKSKSVVVPKRSTCAARDPWYDLTKLVKPGMAFWPMAHHYRHVIPSNPDNLICNHRMFDLSAKAGVNAQVLAGVLNSTIVALWKNFYGRFTGTEGSLDTEIIDVKVLEIPDPRKASAEIAERIINSFDRLATRPMGRLVEEQLMSCRAPEGAKRIASGPQILPIELTQADRRALDDAVFELLGVGNPRQRQVLIDKLYLETASHFRRIRVVEIQKQEQRARGGVRRFSIDELAADAWDAVELSNWNNLDEWLAKEARPTRTFVIPAGATASLTAASDMYDRNTVYFGRGKQATRIDCDSRTQAELLAKLADLGLAGSVKLPASESHCKLKFAELEQCLLDFRAKFEALALSRSGDERTQGQIVELLMHWLIHGRPAPTSGSETELGLNARLQ